MYLEIITPDQKIYSGDVISIQLPGADGSFGVLNNHAPIISTLISGKIKIVEDKQDPKFFNVKGGVVEVLNNKIIVLAE